MQDEIDLYCPDCGVELEIVFHNGVMYHKCPECEYEIVNNYHIAVKLWAEYLETINMILSAKGIANISISTLDYKRQEIHNKLIDLYNNILEGFDIDWFNNICHSLEKYIDIEGNINENAKIMASFIIRPRKL